MPIYEYKCPECDTTWDELKRMTEHTETHPCPKCKTEAPQQIYGGVGCTGFVEAEGWEEECPMSASMTRKLPVNLANGAG